jgi:PAS domain S-box-containing protein
MPSKRQTGDTIPNWTDKWVASVSDYSIFAVSVERRILTWNPGGVAIHGYEPDELIGQLFDTLYTEEDQQGGCPQQGSRLPDGRGVTTRKGGRILRRHRNHARR